MDVFHQMHSTVMFIVVDDDNSLVSTLDDAAVAAADVAMVQVVFSKFVSFFFHRTVQVNFDRNEKNDTVYFYGTSIN